MSFVNVGEMFLGFEMGHLNLSSTVILFERMGKFSLPFRINWDNANIYKCNKSMLYVYCVNI